MFVSVCAGQNVRACSCIGSRRSIISTALFCSQAHKRPALEPLEPQTHRMHRMGHGLSGPRTASGNSARRLRSEGWAASRGPRARRGVASGRLPRLPRCLRTDILSNIAFSLPYLSDLSYVIQRHHEHHHYGALCLEGRLPARFLPQRADHFNHLGPACRHMIARVHAIDWLHQLRGVVDAHCYSATRAAT